MTQPQLVQAIAARENLERILESLKEGIIAHDLQRRIFYFNQEAERITGYSREEVLGRDCHAVFEAPFCNERCSFCDTGNPPNFDSTAYPLNLISKSGDKRHVELTATMMYQADGERIGVLVSLRDLTELTELQARTETQSSFSNIIGRNSKMQTVFKQIRDVSDYDFPVHISGETGTGKELVAAAIHNESRRAGAPFVPINCGALPDGLIESELFGHVKGAFSGAIRDKKGRFELAHNGTVFLDEVADLSKPLQVKLLRFLQEGSFEKVGGERTVHVSVRVISATNKDLKREVRQHRFREDLYYRLNVIPVHIPPLRERKTDIPLLLNHFLDQSYNKANPAPKRFTDAALAQMMDYPWPGNVRELQNAVQFSIVRSSGHRIDVNDLPLELRNLTCYPSRRGPARKLDAERVKAALRETAGNKARAAKQLGVGRATLYRFLNDHPDLGSTHLTG
ncbi:MAG: sigma 54-interacting transcriptional regulator [Desulfosarcinaceae bacterium]|nr:sigma 54-interacting transcriptional regulator [Desulfosarcinaceae bacterium]